MILDKIIKTKQEEVATLRQKTSAARLRDMAAEMAPCRDFRNALVAESCNIVAEVKCASPSRGRLIVDFDPVRLAGIYEKNGAAAVSVLTDEKYFMGQKDNLVQIRQHVALPILRKDFIIDPLQIYETRAIGADAVLLIARVLGEKLAEFIGLAKQIGLHPLVEVHTEQELESALNANANIIGINNRNLDTFETDIETSCRLKASIPGEKIVVAESGIRGRRDIEALMAAGITAFLIGEHLVVAADAGQKLRELKGEKRDDAG
jgi:indole-3-glycerol phosphate synthase